METSVNKIIENLDEVIRSFDNILKITATDHKKMKPTINETFKETFKALKDLLEYVESKDSGIEEHDFFTDHDSDQCVLCKAREVVNEHEGR